MNSRNMEQLIEKYKREMLSYRDRSSIPYEPEPDTYEAENASLAQEQSQVSTISEPLTDVMAQAEEINEYSDEGSLAAISSSDDGERFVPDDPAYDAMRALQESYEPSVRAVARVPSGHTHDEMAGQSIELEKLREECRKISTGEMEGTAERKKSCNELTQFLEKNMKTGRMEVEAYTADGAFGVEDARVMIFIPLESGNVTVYDGVTDVNGNTPSISLPAPPKEFSIDPEKSKDGNAYAGYTVLVEHPGYLNSVFFNVPVFEGIESIQQVRMIPSGQSNSQSPISVNETEPLTLQ